MTIFSSPRPFKNEFDLIQRNAIQSWIASCPGCEIILVGDDEGTDKAAVDFGIKHISVVERNEEGSILRNSVFKEAQKSAKNDLLCFVNADILLTGNFLEAVRRINFSSFMLSVRRWDLEVKEKINFANNDWQELFLRRIGREGKLHGFSAGDFFIFPKNIKLDMPPFSIKHGGWDNWFIYKFKALGIPVIDATEVITVIHQNHERPRLKSIWKSESGKRELRLAGGFSNMRTLRDADWLLTVDGPKKLPVAGRILSKLLLFFPFKLILILKRKLLS